MDNRAITYVSSAWTLLKMGKAKGDKGMLLHARQKVEEALGLSGGDEVKGIHAIHGEILAELGELDDSLLAFKKALATEPQDSEVLYQAAMVLCRLGDVKHARVSILAAILVDQRKPILWITLSRMYYNEGNYPAAGVCMEITDLLHPGLPVVKQARASLQIDSQAGAIRQASLKERAIKIIESLDEVTSVNELVAAIEGLL